MKNILYAALCAFVLVGFGCTGHGARDQRWTLSFDLPQGWVEYAGGQDGYAGNPSDEVTQASPDITLQSTSDAIVSGGGGDVLPANYQGKPVRQKDFAFVSVSHLDSRRVISDKAEDLGKGFFRLKDCEDGEDCQLGGVYNYTYYYVKGDAKYQFHIVTEGQPVDDAVKTILSAKLVPIEK